MDRPSWDFDKKQWTVDFTPRKPATITSAGDDLAFGWERKKVELRCGCSACPGHMGERCSVTVIRAKEMEDGVVRCFPCKQDADRRRHRKRYAESKG